MNTPTDLPSRGATAFLHTLQLAADKAGHTHLPWEVLLTQTQRLLSGTGMAHMQHATLQSHPAVPMQLPGLFYQPVTQPCKNRAVVLEDAALSNRYFLLIFSEAMTICRLGLLLMLKIMLQGGHGMTRSGCRR